MKMEISNKIYPNKIYSIYKKPLKGGEKWRTTAKATTSLSATTPRNKKQFK